MTLCVKWSNYHLMRFNGPATFATLATLLFGWGGVGCSPDKQETSTSRAAIRINSYQLITGDDSEAEREKWNRAFKNRSHLYGEEPVPFVKQNLRLLPRGKALVLAMEEGRNAVFLAQHGFEVTGIDFSDEAIRKAKRLARKRNVKLNVVNADLNTYSIEPESYDVIVAVEFYRPRLINEIKKGLKKGGAVVWESHTTDHAKNVPGRAIRLDHLLQPGQLGKAFGDYDVLFSREVNDGKNAVASLVARKP